MVIFAFIIVRDDLLPRQIVARAIVKGILGEARLPTARVADRDHTARGRGVLPVGHGAVHIERLAPGTTPKKKKVSETLRDPQRDPKRP